jgi:hypothetical protein
MSSRRLKYIAEAVDPGRICAIIMDSIGKSPGAGVVLRGQATIRVRLLSLVGGPCVIVATSLPDFRAVPSWALEPGPRGLGSLDRCRPAEECQPNEPSWRRHLAGPPQHWQSVEHHRIGCRGRPAAVRTAVFWLNQVVGPAARATTWRYVDHVQPNTSSPRRLTPC